MSRMGQGVKGSWKSALKLEIQGGGESRRGEKERTWSSRKLNSRGERRQRGDTELVWCAVWGLKRAGMGLNVIWYITLSRRKWLLVVLGSCLWEGRTWKQLGKKNSDGLVVETSAQQGWNWSELPLEAPYQLCKAVPWVVLSSWPLPLQLRMILRRLGGNLKWWETQISSQLWWHGTGKFQSKVRPEASLFTGQVLLCIWELKTMFYVFTKIKLKWERGQLRNWFSDWTFIGHFYIPFQVQCLSFHFCTGMPCSHSDAWKTF